MYLRVIGGFRGNVVERMSSCFTRDGLVPCLFGFPLINLERLLGVRGSHRVALYARNSFFSGRKDFVRTGRGLSFKLFKSCTLLLQTQLLEGYQHWALRVPQQPNQALVRKLKCFLCGESTGRSAGPHLNKHLPHERGIDCHALISAKHGSIRILGPLGRL